MNNLAIDGSATLQPGPKLDALVARKWMGWHLSDTRWTGPKANQHSYRVWLDGRDSYTGYDTASDNCFAPSTDPAHAGEARRRAKGWDLHTFNHPSPETVSCTIRVGDDKYIGWCKYREVNGSQSAAEALATCRAIMAVPESEKSVVSVVR